MLLFPDYFDSFYTFSSSIEWDYLFFVNQEGLLTPRHQ